MESPYKRLTLSIDVSQETKDQFLAIQRRWGLPNQQGTLERMIDLLDQLTRDNQEIWVCYPDGTRHRVEMR